MARVRLRPLRVAGRSRLEESVQRAVSAVEALNLVGACEGADQSDVIVEAGSLHHPTKSAIRRPVAPRLGDLSSKPVHSLVEVGLAGCGLGSFTRQPRVRACCGYVVVEQRQRLPALPGDLLGDAADAAYSFSASTSASSALGRCCWASNRLTPLFTRSTSLPMLASSSTCSLINHCRNCRLR